jgi:protein-disulfide isomerase
VSEQEAASDSARGEGSAGPGGAPKRSTGGPDRRRTRTLLGATGVAIAAVVAVVAVTQLTGTTKPAKGTVHLRGVSTVSKLLKGVPQRDLELGNPKAPVVVMEFADFQCPICAAWARDVLPVVIDRYVRTGKVLLVFQGLHFLDNNFGTTDSEQLLRLALAAANQGRLWDVIELIYHNQGAEGSRWATPAFLRSIARAVPGLDAQRALAGRNAPSVNHWIETADAFATQSGVQGTPSFLFRKGKKQGLYPQYADAATFGRLVATLLGQ